MGLKNNRQRVFVEQYLSCWNASEAARRAGYNGESRVIGSRLLTDVDIQAAIQDRLAEITMSSNEVLTRLARIGRANIADFATIRDGQDIQALGDEATVIKKFKRKITRSGDDIVNEEIELELYPADVNLERIGKHLGLFDNGPGSSDDKPLHVWLHSLKENDGTLAEPETKADDIPAD